ncbi:hypothetical protein [Tenacibaculum sp. M341]|uniref:hypothetical protein n=1 Tax=Tenacibaculum sp. M341 TaxID=2530339 RepID=UPI00104ABD14|nr:hypothetical protein [Tenacibaculum sp. M341]TCI90323.1 hypothetical protein EYW44_13895 [Tenacibaculum sp. M341]
MKLKIAAIAMMAFSFTMNAQINFTKDITVNVNSPKELTDANNNSLKVNSTYKIQLITRGTATKTGAEYLAWADDSQWRLRAVNLKGITSNHPILVIENNVIKLKTNHTSNYGVRAFVTELNAVVNGASANAFGSSTQWQRETNNLFYKDGNVGIGTEKPISRFDITNGEFKTYFTGNALTFKNSGRVSYIDKRDSGSLMFRMGENYNHAMVIDNKRNIGIGTTSPNSRLTVFGESGIELRSSSTENQFISIKPRINVQELNPGNSKEAAQITNLNLQHLVIDIKANDANDSFAIRTDSNYDGAVDQISMVVKPNGNIGIGVTKPESKLDVNGIITAKNEIRSKSSNPAILLDESDVADKNWHMQVNGGDLKFYEVNDARNSWKQRMVIKPTTGNVGIGTTTTGNHKLAVEGSIGAREIKVQASGWADFVFENNYELPTLKDVEKHIKEKGHLENIPSAVEVKKDGFFLGEMDAKLLRKIEELTLYTIDQEKKLKTQEDKIEKLEKENSVLKSLLERVSKLEKQVNKQ